MSKKKTVTDLGVVQIAIRERESNNLVHVLVFKDRSRKHIADFYLPYKIVTRGFSELLNATKRRAQDIGITWQYEHFHSLPEQQFNKLLEELN
jgi:FKBP-type peptidyl-prolyl cis-trans isomerase (trigger factor)